MSTLVGLSFRRLGSRPGKNVPMPPTREQRLHAHRAHRPVEFGNGYEWPHYAIEAAKDALAVETERGYAALSRGE